MLSLWAPASVFRRDRNWILALSVEFDQFRRRAANCQLKLRTGNISSCLDRQIEGLLLALSSLLFLCLMRAISIFQRDGCDIWRHFNMALPKFIF